MLAILLFSIVNQLYAQQPNNKVKANLSADSILIGDHIDLTLQVDANGGEQFGFPELKDGLIQGIDIVETYPLDTLRNNGQLIIQQKYTITSFDSGMHVIPPIPVLIGSTTAVDTFFSQSLVVNVNTIPIDTATYVIYDIKAPMAYAFNILDYWLWIVIFLAVLIIGGLIMYFVIWRKDKGNVFWLQKPKKAPYAVAIDELQKLKTEQLWQKDKTKEYYTRLTDILRQYLEDVFDIQAMEKTSDEILEALDKLNFDKRDLYESLKDLFSYADLAKFAKYNPLPNENEQSYQNAYKFIEGTKPVEENNQSKTINTQDDNNTKI